MSDPGVPVPEPTEEDEHRALGFLRIREATELTGAPEGDERCGDCHFYLASGEDLSYCWHDDLEIVVDSGWWCSRWQADDTVDAEPTAEDRRTGATLHAQLVEDQQWVDHPVDGERCARCLFYLDPGASVSYCWNPALRVGVGADHWCRRWEAAPETQADAF